MIPSEFRTAVMAARQAIKNRQATEEKRQGDPYSMRMQAALATISRPDYPAGMIPWLGEAHLDLYDELTGHIPDEINLAWKCRAPLAEFDAILERFVETHRRACDLYRIHRQNLAQGVLASRQEAEQAK